MFKKDRAALEAVIAEQAATITQLRQALATMSEALDRARTHAARFGLETR